MPSLSEYSKLFLDKELDLDAPRQEGGSTVSHDPSLPSIDINQLASLIPNFQGGMDRSVSVQPSAEEVEVPVKPIPQVQEPGFNLNYVKDRLLGKAQAPSQFDVSDLMASVPNTSSVAAPATMETQPEFVDDSMNARQKDGFWNWLKSKNPSGPVASSSEANPYSGSIANLDEYYRQSGQAAKADEMRAALAKDDAEGQKVQDDFIKRLTSQTPSGVRVSQLGDDIARIMLGGMPGSDAAAPANIELQGKNLEAQNKRALLDQQIQERHRKEDKEFQLTNRNVDRQIAQDARVFQQYEALTDNQRALQFQKSQNAQKRADIAAQTAALVRDYIAKGYPAPEAQRQANAIAGAAYASLDQADKQVDSQLALNRQRMEAFQKQYSGQVPQSSGISAAIAPSSGGRSTGVSQEAPKSAQQTQIDEVNRQLEIPIAGQVRHLKPEFLSKKDKLSETANSMSNAIESLDQFEGDVLGFLDAAKKGDMSIEQAAERIGELTSQIPNASGKLLNAEGLSGTVSSLEATEKALGTTMEGLMNAYIGGKVPLGAAGPLIDIYRGKIKGNINGYRKAIEGGKKNWERTYTQEGSGSSESSGSSKQSGVKMTRGSETQVVAPNKVEAKKALGWTEVK